MNSPSFLKRLVFTFFVFVCFLKPNLHATIIYDLTAEFSQIANPNGPWTYEMDGAPITATLPGGWGYYASYDASITQAGSSFGLDAKPGDILMHAPSAGHGTTLEIVWTSPGTGTIDISGAAWGADFFQDRDATWWLSVDGVTIASRGSVYGLLRTDLAADFASNLLSGGSLTDLNVETGDVVKFSVAATTYYGHFVGIEEKIAFSPSIPSVPDAGSTFPLFVASVSMLAASFRILKR